MIYHFLVTFDQAYFNELNSQKSAQFAAAHARQNFFFITGTLKINWNGRTQNLNNESDCEIWMTSLFNSIQIPFKFSLYTWYKILIPPENYILSGLIFPAITKNPCYIHSGCTSTIFYGLHIGDPDLSEYELLCWSSLMVVQNPQKKS